MRDGMKVYIVQGGQVPRILHHDDGQEITGQPLTLRLLNSQEDTKNWTRWQDEPQNW
jgi:hypothetical protein